MKVSDIQSQIDAFILNTLARTDSTAREICSFLDDYLSQYRIALPSICARLNFLQRAKLVACLEAEPDPTNAIFCLTADDLPMFSLDDDLIDQFADHNDVPLYDDPSDDEVYLLVGPDDRWELHLYDEPLQLLLDEEQEDEVSPVDDADPSDHTDADVFDTPREIGEQPTAERMEEEQQSTERSVDSCEDHEDDLSAPEQSNTIEENELTPNETSPLLDDEQDVDKEEDFYDYIEEDTPVFDALVDEEVLSTDSQQSEETIEDMPQTEETADSPLTDDVPEERSDPLSDEDLPWEEDDSPALLPSDTQEDPALIDGNETDDVDIAEEDAHDPANIVEEQIDLDDKVVSDEDSPFDQSSEEQLSDDELNTIPNEAAVINDEPNSYDVSEPIPGNDGEGSIVEVEEEAIHDQHDQNIEADQVDEDTTDTAESELSHPVEDSDLSKDNDIVTDPVDSPQEDQESIEENVEPADERLSDDELSNQESAQQLVEAAVEQNENELFDNSPTLVSDEQLSAEIEYPLSSTQAEQEQPNVAEIEDHSPVDEHTSDAETTIVDETAPSEPEEIEQAQDSARYEQISVFDDNSLLGEESAPAPRSRKSKKDKKVKPAPQVEEQQEEPEVAEPTPIEAQIAAEEAERRRLAMMRLGMLPGMTPETPHEETAPEQVEAPIEPTPQPESSIRYDSMHNPTGQLEQYLSEAETEHKFMYHSILLNVFRDVVPQTPAEDDSGEVALVTSITELREEMRKKGYVVNQYVQQNTYQYYSKKYVLSNKLNLVTSLITYLVGLAMILVALFAIDPHVGWGWDKYVIAACVLLVFPAIRAVRYLIYRDRHQPADFSFKFSFATSWMAAIILIVIDLLVAFFIPIPGTNANISVVSSLVVPIFYPAAIFLLLPIRTLIYSLLYHTKKFHL